MPVRSSGSIQFSGKRKISRFASQSRYRFIHDHQSASIAIGETFTEGLTALPSSRFKKHLWTKVWSDDIARRSRDVCTTGSIPGSTRKYSKSWFGLSRLSALTR